MVEHLLAKEGVASSNLVFRSHPPLVHHHNQRPATSPSGKAGVCKTPITGSNPVVASQAQRRASPGAPLFMRADVRAARLRPVSRPGGGTADAADLKSAAARHEGSTPSLGTRAACR